MKRMTQIVDSIPPAVAHATGVASGATSLIVLAENGSTVIGFLAAVAALIGGSFYAFYWIVKAWRQWKGTGQ